MAMPVSDGQVGDGSAAIGGPEHHGRPGRRRLETVFPEPLIIVGVVRFAP
jgi:hypothetical protein